ncbi:MAG TPA: T9SS type A sorting domain-containing protein [Chitinophagaceae bacterium]|nr:T9SS type A sorting domain-containing protein [Chitinophagaceae bacterium]
MNPILQEALYVSLFQLLSFHTLAQGDGLINRIATSLSGRAVLDPNGDGYTSLSTSGFLGNDVSNSEIPYKAVPSFSTEPNSDLRRGPNHLYSDFVPDSSGNGFYVYYNGSNLLFRFRVGSIIPGSKGYSVLIDTDGKFGPAGVSADTNYRAATTGTNGNPGFEIEIVLETNSRIAIYNVDGTSSPVLIKSYANWQDMSQVSIAGTNDNGDPDFYIDFYIPFSDLQAAPFNLTTSSTLRLLATTVVSPQASIGGPKSDIYGLSDSAYNNTNEQFTAYINAQCGVSVTNLSGGGSGFCPKCTMAPVINGAIGTGVVTISGTWTASPLTGSATTATIVVYKNGISVGTVTNVASGSSWNLPGVTTANNDIITATAQGTGESVCLVSNNVTALGCNSANIPSTMGFSITCISTRGLEGTFLGTNTVKLYFINSALVTTVLAGPAANSPTFGYSGSNWYYNGINYNGSNVTSACSGGMPDLTNGTYYVTTIAPGSNCESAPVFACRGLSTTATPVIAQTTLFTSSKIVSGTATSGATVYLWINGQPITTTIATGGNYSFNNLTLSLGDVIMVTAITANNCMSAAALRTVTCYTNPPLITADNNNQITSGQPISGTSSEAAGTVIRVYTSTNRLAATTSVQANGTWSTGNAGTTPAIYNSVTDTSYYATAQTGSCSVSANSGNVMASPATSSSRCSSISGTPIGSSATSVSGTLNGSFTTTTVNLYLDDVLIGSTSTNNTNWGPITVNSTLNNTLYANGVLRIGVRESGKQEVACPLSATAITCAPSPTSPIYTPSFASIALNQVLTYTISNAQTGYFYSVADAITGKPLSTGKWATVNGDLPITTFPFTSQGIFNNVIKATSVNGLTVCSITNPSTAAISVGAPLPLNLISFSGQWVDNKILLSWTTESEINVSHIEIERSNKNNNFNQIGLVKATGNNSGLKQFYSFVDNSPFSPVTYYRLRIVDEDGSAKYSWIISFKNTNSNVVSISPNPFNDRINIVLNSRANSLLEASILDLSGKSVRSATFRINKGKNQLGLDNIAQLAQGIYLLKLKDASDNNVTYHKLVK